MESGSRRLTAAVEDYFTALRRIRASGGATGERSSYAPLAALLDAVGATLRPRVFCVGELADQGAGHPDFGLYTARQVQRGRPRPGQAPERGVVEVKPAADDPRAPAVREQAARYWARYRLVLVTNLREFTLIGPGADGAETTLEAFRLAASGAEFDRRLQRPRAFARDTGDALGEYLGRALTHAAALAEPRDLAWLLASYARDGLARVTAAGDAPALGALRAALEEALGVRFKGERGARFDAHAVRAALLARGGPNEEGFVRFAYRPFDYRWLYWEADTKLLDEKRAYYMPHVFAGNLWMSAAQHLRRGAMEP